VPPCLIGIEVGMGTHYLTRAISQLGHDARQVPPFYIKAFRQAHKNDFRDAHAVAEAVQRPTTTCVPAKTDEQLDLQALHRVRYRLVGQRTAVINQIRGFLLEHGIAVRQRLHWLRQALPDILGKRAGDLSPRMIRILEDLALDWRHLDARIDALTAEIGTLSREAEGCRRLMTIPGIGPIISSAVVAAIGSGSAFMRGRDFAAWLGLVPRQMSTGDRTILGRITKRGNGYLRMLFMQAAASSYYDQRVGQSMASVPGSPRRLSDYITTCWPPRSPTSWPALHGVCLRKGGTTRRALRSRRHDMGLLRFTKGMAANPSPQRRSPRVVERATVAPPGGPTSLGQEGQAGARYACRAHV
jgi:transposase